MADNSRPWLENKKQHRESKYVISDEEPNIPSTTRKSSSSDPSFQAEEGSTSGRESSNTTKESSGTLNSSIVFDHELSREGHKKSTTSARQMDEAITNINETTINEEVLELVPMTKSIIKHSPEDVTSSFLYRDSDSTFNSSSTKEAIDTIKEQLYPSVKLEAASSSSNSLKDEKNADKTQMTSSIKDEQKINTDFCIAMPTTSPETLSITSEKQKQYMHSLLTIRKNMEPAYLSIGNNKEPQSTLCFSGINKRTLQRWCHTMTLFSLLYVIISILYVVGTTVGLLTYQYTYGTVSNETSAQISYKIISRAILMKPEILQSLDSSSICHDNISIDAINVTKCKLDVDAYNEIWQSCILADQKRYKKYDCKCCRDTQSEQKQQKRQDEIELCLTEEDNVGNTKFLSRVVNKIENDNSTITTSDIYDAEIYGKRQRETVYEVRKIVQLVALLILAISSGLCVITWCAKKFVDTCCSRGVKCFEICCSKIILDEPDQNDDQVLIDKAIAARRREIAARNNRVHCNVARTESLQFDEKSII